MFTENRKLWELEFCVKHKLTQQQFNYLYLEYLQRRYTLTNNKKGLASLQKYVKSYINWVKVFLSENEERYLIDDGFLDKDSILTDKFLKLFCDDYVIVEELYEAYPYQTKSTSGTFMLKGWDKEECQKLYPKNIDYLVQEHLEVLKDIQYGIANNMINYKLESFVKNKLWLDIRRLRGNKKADSKKAVKHNEL